MFFSLWFVFIVAHRWRTKRPLLFVFLLFFLPLKSTTQLLTNSKNNLLIKNLIVYTNEIFFKTMFDDSHG